MKFDEKLATDFRSLRRKPREELQKLYDGYEVACELSSLPNKERAAHWEAIARNRWAKLRNRITGETVRSEPTANPINEPLAKAELVEDLP